MAYNYFRIQNEENTEWINWINDEIEKVVPGRTPSYHNPYHSRIDGRFIQLPSVSNNPYVHYEYIDGLMCFHVEDISLRTTILKYIRNKVANNNELAWKDQCSVKNGCCYLKEFKIYSGEELAAAFKKMTDIFDPLIKEAEEVIPQIDRASSYNFPESFQFKSLINDEDHAEVQCTTKNLRELFHSDITIPDYQRDYCWGHDEISNLISSLSDIKEGEPYHLGTVILHYKDGKYNVVDGQQRLTTLTLLLRELGYNDAMPLLKQKFMSNNSINHVAYAKYLIQNLMNNRKKNVSNSNYAEIIANNITFSVLILNSDNIDLAYTFFSNQNSKGVPLSDFDLLKAHHLRYINIDEQAEHLAIRWNAMMKEDDRINPVNSLQQSLGTHIYRLRHWLRSDVADETRERRVKDEYVAAPIIRSIPPFGEQFVYHDKIQGGSHFFAFASHFVSVFNDFVNTPQVGLLRQHLSGYSHSRYANVIETLLFAYYLKFNRQYLSEALFCISSVMADHRYSNSRALTYKILEHACKSHILLMIEQASSPTFFLAEAINAIRYSGLDLEDDDIRQDFYNRLYDMFKNMPELSNNEIKERINNEYQF